MNRYFVCDEADMDRFIELCAEIENHIFGLSKHDMIQDVDGTFIKKYDYNDKKILVYCSFEDDEIFIRTDLDLTIYFPNLPAPYIE
jgi:hypothetical protein